MTWCVCLLACLAGPAAGGAESLVPPIPAKTVVLTFDDGVRSHLEFAAPLLKEYGFGATFFVTHAWMADNEHYLSWDEIAVLHGMGFEIGNHTWDHAALHEPPHEEMVHEQLRRVEEALRKAGVPRPVSLGWPGNHFGPVALSVLRERGYRLARRGPQPGPDPGEVAVVGMGPCYQPAKHAPLLVPTSGLATPHWTLSDFKQVVNRAELGRAVVLQFHGVPDLVHPSCSVEAARFRSFMDYLKEENFNVVALRDIAPYASAHTPGSDPNEAKAFFR